MGSLERLSLAFGWIAFAAWSISFYPQIILNFRRKSVQGLSFDFVALNVLGFACYTVANTVLKASAVVRQEYARRHDGGFPSVQWSDVAFGVHAIVVTTVTLMQTRLYKSDGGQRVSLWNRITVGLLVAAILLTTVVAAVYETRGGHKDVEYLDLVLVVSSIKIYISFAKYVPQAWINFRRKSTVGWSISNILLDLTGGLLNFSQMAIDASVARDWSSMTSNPAKLVVACLSIAFDLVFVVQHFVLYRSSTGEKASLDEEMHARAAF